MAEKAIRTWVAYAMHPSVTGFYYVGKVSGNDYDAAWEAAYGLALNRGFMPDTVKILREGLPGILEEEFGI